MLLSMTGFGAGQTNRDGIRLSVEIRSVNGRFCDVTVRAPRWMSEIESKVKERVQREVTRGTVTVMIDWKEESESARRLSVDHELARAYRDRLLELQDLLGIEGTIDLDLLTRFPDIFRSEPPSYDMEFAWTLVAEACDEALSRHQEMRQAEGAAIQSDFQERLRNLEELLREVERLAPMRVDRVKIRLKERISKLLDSGEVDESRLAMEVALFADRADVTEECVRLHSCIQQFLEAMETDEAVGRKITFILQEMSREANTLGAKANDPDVSHLAVGIKEELERLREQVQNVE